MKAVIVAYENEINGPAWQAAYGSYEMGNAIEGAIGIDASKPANRVQMQALGITAPAIIIARYCSGNGQTHVKYLAQMKGIPSPSAIADAAAKVMQSSSAQNCNSSANPVPVLTNSGSGTDEGESSGFGLNPWGIFSLPFDAPWWVWAAIAGGAAIGSTSADGKLGRYGWGAVAVVAGGNALTAYKKQ